MATYIPIYPRKGYAFPNSSDRIDLGSWACDANKLAFAAKFTINATPARIRAIFNNFNGTTVEPFFAAFSSGTTVFNLGTQGSGATYPSLAWTSGFAIGERHVLLGIIDTASDTIALYADGKLTPVATASLGGQTIPTTSVSGPIGNLGTSFTRGCSLTLADACIWNGSIPTLTDIDAYFNGADPRSLNVRPTNYWPLQSDVRDYIGLLHGTVSGAAPGIAGSFPSRAARLRIYFGVGAGASNTTVTPSTGSIIIAGSAPTVAQTAHVSIAPTQGALVIAGAAPTVAVTGNYALTPDQGTLVISGQAPTVTQTTNAAMTPTQGQVVISGYAPTVNTGFSIAPAVGGIVISGAAPTVTQTTNATPTPTQGSLTLTGYAPTVEATGTSIWTNVSAASTIWTNATAATTSWTNQ